jgi:glycosyltransferase involved in cell wall biosynthesis
VECAERVSRQIANARFVWVGDGGLGPEWDQQVAERGLGAVVQRVAWQADVPAFLLAADVFLHVAEYEGLPLAILEALSAGLPCAITENLLGEMPFLNPHNSISVGAGDDWIATLRDPEKLAAIGAAGRALAEAEFSFGEMAARYEGLYRESAEAAA